MTTAPHAARPEDLDRFIRAAKAGGIPDDALVPLLKQNGWSERRVYQILSGYYGETLGMPTPSRSGRTENARDAFYYLLNFITLGFWTVALGQLFHTLIGHWFPDPARVDAYTGSLLSQVAWQLATIIVAFPCFAVVGRLIAGELERRPDAAESGVRAWLTYVALVIAALIVLGDGIAFLQAFLTGQLTTRFVLDSLVLLVLGGGVFGYYLTGLARATSRR